MPVLKLNPRTELHVCDMPRKKDEAADDWLLDNPPYGAGTIWMCSVCERLYIVSNHDMWVEEYYMSFRHMREARKLRRRYRREGK